MLAAPEQRSLFAYELGPRQSQRVLEQAVRAEARMTLTLRTEEAPALHGVIVSGSAESLWIGIDQPEIRLTTGLQSVCCDGVLELNEARYLLSSNVLAVANEDDVRRLEIARPQGLQILQRRRFWRAQMQDSSPVLVSRPGVGQEHSWSCTASMMNVSVDGLAGLAGQSDADAAPVGERLRVVFRICRAEEPFVVDAVLKSKTAAGTDGQIVLGLQLDLGDDPDQQRRLHAALERLA